MKNYLISADTILIVFTGVLIVVGLFTINLVKDIQDLQTRITIMEKNYGKE